MSKFYAHLEARREAEVWPSILGVTGGLESACGGLFACSAVGSMFQALGSDAMLLLGSLDAPNGMPAGSMCGVTLPAGVNLGQPAVGQRWTYRP